MSEDARETIIEVRGLARDFGSRRVLDGIDLDVGRGETLVIMGGSGCGKSTLLRHIVGTLKPTEGSVKIFGRDITKLTRRELDSIRLRFGMNFQFGALLQSLSVGENVALPLLENSRIDPSVAELVVKMKLELVGLTGFEDMKPSQLSGGMRKRVGLARAVALDPEILFSDEPTSGLDPIMTAVIDQLTLDLTKKLEMTAVVVTHDMVSAFRIADQIIVLGAGTRAGKVIARGTPAEIRSNTDPEVQQFINGEPDGPIPLKLSPEDYISRLLGHERNKGVDY
jgi:phospholipid/cholesterol/gamma-HCH transport system ATP-binding protein